MVVKTRLLWKSNLSGVTRDDRVKYVQIIFKEDR